MANIAKVESNTKKQLVDFFALLRRILYYGNIAKVESNTKNNFLIFLHCRGASAAAHAGNVCGGVEIPIILRTFAIGFERLYDRTHNNCR